MAFILLTRTKEKSLSREVTILRKKLFAYNTITALVKQIVTIICGFILPKYILSYYGSNVNGLITSITQFLGFISFLELGIGPVIQSNLYKPLANKDYDEISKIVVSTERFFHRIAMIFLMYIAVLLAVFPTVINQAYDWWYTGSLIVIIAISTFAQYYFGITYQLFLNADQRSYIQTTMQIVTILLNTVVSVVLMRGGFSVQAVKLSTAVIYLLRPIGQTMYVHTHYKIDKKIQFTGEPIKQKWSGFAQHLAAVVVSNTDVTVLTILSTMKNVSIYSVYYNVVYGINSIVMNMVGGLESLWGNMLARNEKKRLMETFEEVECIIHAGCTFLFTVTGILIIPFIKIYTADISDANYIVPVFGTLLTAAYGIQCLRIPYFRIIKAAGHYRQTQNGALVEMILNVIISILLVSQFGLNGVAAGTLIAMLYHTVYFAWYLRKNILYRKFWYFIKHIVVDLFSAFVCAGICSHFNLEASSYISWIIIAVKVGMLCSVICLIVNFVFYSKIFIRLIRSVR